MLVLDVTVVAIALPQIGADLGLARDTLTWVVSAYMLMFGGLMLLGGRIAQGVGAAMLSPEALSVVVVSFQGEERNRALGIWSALGGGGAAIGVLLGGLLTAGPGWPWVFYINVPIGLVSLAVLSRLLPALPAAGRSRLDVPGALLVTVATATTIYALINAGDRGWLTAATLGPLAAAAVLYATLGASTAGIGATFVVASTTALARVGQHEAGLASGIVSTFHGAALGAAVISSIAGASILGTGGTGFTRGFAAAAVTAAVAGALAAIVVPTAERSAQAVPMQSREP